MGADEVDWGGYGIAVTKLDDGEIDSLLGQREEVGRAVPRVAGGRAMFPCRSLKPTIPFSLLPDEFFCKSVGDRLNEEYGDMVTTSPRESFE